jgi:hypothetical protein
MPSPVATAGGTAQTTQTDQTTPRAGLVVPFRRATKEHRELVTTYTQTMTVNPQAPPNGVIQIPAYGYARGVFVKLTASGGVGASVFAEDGPHSALQNIMLSEPNGAPIYQLSSGYNVMLGRKYGGYFGFNDPENSRYTVNTANGNFSVLYYIPFELNERDGLGSLPNQNAAAQFLLRYQLAGSAAVYTTPPGTLPLITFEVWVNEYDQPAATSDNAANATTPPSMNTTQFWSEQQYPIVAGFNRIRLTRVGNYIRNLGFVFRTTAAGTRAAGDTNWPAQLEIDIDARPVTFEDKEIWRDTIYQRYGYSANALTALDAVGGQDAGVMWFDLMHEFDGRAGHENRDGWWKTYGSTRLEIVGTFGAAGTLTVLTNDVAIASNVFLG